MRQVLSTRRRLQLKVEVMPRFRILALPASRPFRPSQIVFLGKASILTSDNDFAICDELGQPLP
jgi:hypothetical protein